MCILFLHHHSSSSSVSSSLSSAGAGAQGNCTCPYLLVAASNRDEFFERPTNPLGFWEENSSILAGQDIQSAEICERGTWLGVSRKGKFAALTNYRCHVREIKPEARTRGLIVSNYLSGETTPQEYCTSLLQQGHTYNGFSLIVGHCSNESSELAYCSNRDEGGVQMLGAGDYGLSNAQLDSPWSKVRRGKGRFTHLIQSLEGSTDRNQLTESLMEILQDDTCLHPDPNIPDVGYTEDILKSTSSVFVQPVTLYGRKYGTRTSSVVLVDRNNGVTFTERTLTLPDHDPHWNTKQYSFTISVDPH